MKLTPDPWLSDILGYEASNLDVQAVSDAEGFSRAWAKVLRSSHQSLVTAKVPTYDIQSLRLLEGAGYRIVDTLVTFQLSGQRLSKFPSSFFPPFLSMRHWQTQKLGPMGEGDIDACWIEIAARAFRFSRFHLDPLLAPVADMIKREWARSYLLGKRGSDILLGYKEDVLVGFLAVQGPNTADNPRPAAIIDLIGVDPGHQGKGIGKALIEHLMAYYLKWPVQAGTQVCNTASLSLYGSLGFKIVDSAYVLHLHTGVAPVC